MNKMLIRTVSVTFYFILCFTATSAKMTIVVDGCETRMVDNKMICLYNAGVFLKFNCQSMDSDANINITRQNDTFTISVFEGHINRLSVSQYFTEQQDGEKWKCTVQSSKGNEEMMFLFKLRNEPNRIMGLHSAIDKTNYTVVWIAIGCCSLISLFAVISAVVAVKCITANRKPVKKESECSPALSTCRKYSSGADDNDTCESVYDRLYDETYSKGQMDNMYSNTSAPLNEMQTFRIYPDSPRQVANAPNLFSCDTR